MKTVLFIVETLTEAGTKVTHFTGSVQDARSEARDLSAKHKMHTTSMERWEFYGKGRDVTVAIAACIQMVGEGDEVTTNYSGKCTSKLIETTTFRRGRKHTSSITETPLLSDASEPAT